MNLILKQVSALPPLTGDYQKCLVSYRDWDFRLLTALKPNPSLLGYLSGNTDVFEPVLPRPDKQARLIAIAEMESLAERRVAKILLETEVLSWQKYDEFVLHSGMLLTSIISIIEIIPF